MSHYLCIWPFFGIVMLLQMSVSKILSHRRLWYFKTTKILQKWLQTWFILLHLALVWNVRVKSIWIHSGGGDNYSCSSENLDFPVVWICSLRNVQNYQIHFFKNHPKKCLPHEPAQFRFPVLAVKLFPIFKACNKVQT